MKRYTDKDIIESWKKNVSSWVKAIAREEISSRIEVTNKAILDAVKKYKPTNLLDVGCGEGWLIRELSKAGIDCLGIDAIPEFAEYVNKSGGRFKLLPYEEFGPTAFDQGFDVIVCNFSLLGKESVEMVIEQSTAVLNPEGALIVQTVHPVEASNKINYVDGWRPGSWEDFDDGFVDPAPWYFRTLESWQNLFVKAGFKSLAFNEPFHPKSGKRVSVIFEASMGI